MPGFSDYHRFTGCCGETTVFAQGDGNMENHARLELLLVGGLLGDGSHHESPWIFAYFNRKSANFIADHSSPFVGKRIGRGLLIVADHKA